MSAHDTLERGLSEARSASQQLGSDDDKRNLARLAGVELGSLHMIRLECSHVLTGRVLDVTWSASNQPIGLSLVGRRFVPWAAIASIEVVPS